MKKILGLILVFALGLLLIGCKENPTLTFEQSSISVEVGQEFELQPKIENLEGKYGADPYLRKIIDWRD